MSNEIATRYHSMHNQAKYVYAKVTDTLGHTCKRVTVYVTSGTIGTIGVQLAHEDALAFAADIIKAATLAKETELTLMLTGEKNVT